MYDIYRLLREENIYECVYTELVKQVKYSATKHENNNQHQMQPFITRLPRIIQTFKYHNTFNKTLRLSV